MSNRFRNVLPPLPPKRSPIYSGNKEIGTLDHNTHQIAFYHTPFIYCVEGTQPGSTITDHLGNVVGWLGYNGQMHRFKQ